MCWLCLEISGDYKLFTMKVNFPWFLFLRVDVDHFIRRVKTRSLVMRSHRPGFPFDPPAKREPGKRTHKKPDANSYSSLVQTHGANDTTPIPDYPFRLWPRWNPTTFQNPLLPTIPHSCGPPNELPYLSLRDHSNFLRFFRTNIRRSTLY